MFKSILANDTNNALGLLTVCYEGGDDGNSGCNDIDWLCKRKEVFISRLSLFLNNRTKSENFHKIISIIQDVIHRIEFLYDFVKKWRILFFLNFKL